MNGTPSTADALVHVVDTASAVLRRISDEVAATKPGPATWSIKEIVGHLVDSAANNHQRFVRAPQVDTLAFPGYAQDAWVRLQDYQTASWPALVDLWVASDHHLAHTISRLPEVALAVPCRIGDGEAVTLRFLIEDYLVHMRHHLAEIDKRRASAALGYHPL